MLPRCAGGTDGPGFADGIIIAVTSAVLTGRGEPASLMFCCFRASWRSIADLCFPPTGCGRGLTVRGCATKPEESEPLGTERPSLLRWGGCVSIDGLTIMINVNRKENKGMPLCSSMGKGAVWEHSASRGMRWAGALSHPGCSHWGTHRALREPRAGRTL